MKKIFVQIKDILKTYTQNIKTNTKYDEVLKERIQELLNNPRFQSSNCKTKKQLMTSINTVFTEIYPLHSTLFLSCNQKNNKKLIKVLEEFRDTISIQKVSEVSDCINTIQSIIDGCRVETNPNFETVIYTKEYYSKNNELPKTKKLKQILNKDNLTTGNLTTGNLTTGNLTTGDYYSERLIHRQKLMQIEQFINQNKLLPLAGILSQNHDERIL